MRNTATLFASVREQPIGDPWRRGWGFQDADCIHPPGPRELSINSLAALDILYGPASQCERVKWYDGNGADPNYASLLEIRDKALHKRRKKIWERGLSFKGESSATPFPSPFPLCTKIDTRQLSRLMNLGWYPKPTCSFRTLPASWANQSTWPSAACSSASTRWAT